MFNTFITSDVIGGGMSKTCPYCGCDYSDDSSHRGTELIEFINCSECTSTANFVDGELRKFVTPEDDIKTPEAAIY